MGGRVRPLPQEEEEKIRRRVGDWPANVDDKEQTDADVENDDRRHTEYYHQRQP